MTLITRHLTLQMKKLANFIVLEGENKECYWYAPYTNDICAHWRFVNETAAHKSSTTIYQMFCDYKSRQDFIGMDMARKFLEMGFTRARRYANHPSGKKYDAEGNCTPQSAEWRNCEKARSATIFKEKRDLAAKDPIYVEMRKAWRASE